MSEGPQQKEISTMWSRSERQRDKKIRKDRSRKPEGPQQNAGERVSVIKPSSDTELSFIAVNKKLALSN
ncbi:hypothetical protein Y032_0822g2533 [Ancylostoma ceylanicum]|uniref:Uncharacterized protein n=1 Tax=Ancylostoma ceylanicum TaxID=53326 RepID=A0A016WCY1_9BILA|nr:hypothetical protein Y032_0822g2533 [Ancylostoma ceylanicum]